MGIIKLNKIRAFLNKNAQPKKVLLLVLLTQVVYFYMILVSIPHLIEIAEGLKIPDLMPTGYNYNYIMELLTALGQEGRDYYLYHQLPVDFLYPGLFAVSYSLLLTFLFNKALYPNNWIIKLNIVPLIAGTADYIENLFFISMLRNYPEVSKLTVSAAQLFSLIKSAFTTIFFVLLIYGIVMVIVNRRRIKDNQYKT